MKSRRSITSACWEPFFEVRGLSVARVASGSSDWVLVRLPVGRGADVGELGDE